MFGHAADVLQILVFLQALATALTVPAWCHYDARQHGHPFGTGLRLLVLFVAVIGFPIYAFRTRGVRGFRLIASALAILVAVSVAAELAASAGAGMAARLGW
jgi:hypothetical protein